MIVAFKNRDGKVRRASAEITTRHSSSNGQPVLVLSGGEVVDKESWVVLGCRLVSATTKERYGLKKIGLIYREP